MHTTSTEQPPARNGFLAHLVQKEHLIITAAVLIFTLIVLGAVSLLRAGYLGSSVIEGKIASASYEAVTLENGKVYFGKISNSDTEFLTLTNVYLLDANAKKLIKQSDEMYGPTDTIALSQTKIISIENLAANGSAMKAIESHQSKNKINQKQNTEKTQK